MVTQDTTIQSPQLKSGLNMQRPCIIIFQIAMSSNQDQQIQDLHAQLEQAKAETVSVRKSLTEAQQKLSAVAPVSLFPINRSHIALTASQIPDCEELTRIAQQKDASIVSLRSGQLEVIRKKMRDDFLQI
jgi:hypothetical protein